jgi:CheY-like chemotaxis protein
MTSTASTMPTVLIADDDSVLNQVWRDLLAGAGFDVLTCSNGLKALDTIRYGNKVDVVLLDYNMPQLDGAQTLEHLKEQFPDVKAIGVTGIERSQLPAAYCDGVEALLAKPVKSSDLIDAIHSAIGAPSAADAAADKRAMNWARFLPWYALFLTASLGLMFLLRQATIAVLTSP